MLSEHLKKFFRSLARKIVARLVKRRLKQGVVMGGEFFVQHRRAGQVIGRYPADDPIVNGGLDDILNVWGHGGAQTNPWYAFLISGYGDPALDNADTMGSHAGWTELEDYDEATRPAYVEAAASSQVMTNVASPATFTISDTATVYGIGLCSDNVKGASDGTLWCTAAFSAEIPVVDGDELNVVYQLTASRV